MIVTVGGMQVLIYARGNSLVYFHDLNYYINLVFYMYLQCITVLLFSGNTAQMWHVSSG
jgi:hypothetical protein